MNESNAEHGSVLPTAPTLRARIQPEETILDIPRHKAKTVLSLLKVLGIRPGTAIVARGRELLTPDRALYAGDELLVRKVTSAG